MSKDTYNLTGRLVIPVTLEKVAIMVEDRIYYQALYRYPCGTAYVVTHATDWNASIEEKIANLSPQRLNGGHCPECQTMHKRGYCDPAIIAEEIKKSEQMLT